MKIKYINWKYEAFEEYLSWQKIDKKVFARINKLIKEIKRTPFEGIGKPEPLKDNLSGLWSRKIDKEHRIVYFIDGDALVILQVRGHY